MSKHTEQVFTRLTEAHRLLALCADIDEVRLWTYREKRHDMHLTFRAKYRTEDVPGRPSTHTETVHVVRLTLDIDHTNTYEATGISRRSRRQALSLAVDDLRAKLQGET